MSTCGSLNVNFLNLKHFSVFFLLLYECVCVCEFEFLKHYLFSLIQALSSTRVRERLNKGVIKLVRCNSSNNEFREFRNEKKRALVTAFYGEISPHPHLRCVFVSVPFYS